MAVRQHGPRERLGAPVPGRHVCRPAPPRHRPGERAAAVPAPPAHQRAARPAAARAEQLVHLLPYRSGGPRIQRVELALHEERLPRAGQWARGRERHLRRPGGRHGDLGPSLREHRPVPLPDGRVPTQQRPRGEHLPDLRAVPALVAHERPGRVPAAGERAGRPAAPLQSRRLRPDAPADVRFRLRPLRGAPGPVPVVDSHRLVHLRGRPDHRRRPRHPHPGRPDGLPRGGTVPLPLASGGASSREADTSRPTAPTPPSATSKRVTATPTCTRSSTFPGNST